MACIITSYNLKAYQDRAHPDITGAVWKVMGPRMDARVLANLPNLLRLHCPGCGLTSLEELINSPKLVALDCSSNNLGSLDGLQFCPDLELLNCSKSNIKRLGPGLVSRFSRLFREPKATGIEGCPKLLELDCSHNDLTSLGGLQVCTQLRKLSYKCNFGVGTADLHYFSQLQHLDLSGTRSTSIQSIRDCVHLINLECSVNSLTSLEGIEGLHELKGLGCDFNEIPSISAISNCPSLERLTVSHNRILSLDGVQYCPLLRILSCDYNGITRLDHLVILRNLIVLRVENNPLTVQNPQVQRFLENYRNHHSANMTVYDNGQNVHDTHVQKSVSESVANLMGDPRPAFTTSTISESNLNKTTIRLLLKYCNDKSVHSVHQLTYFELLGYVWQRIEKSKEKGELFKILAEQVLDSKGQCFTGRFNRLLSVLVGFCPDITIAISDSSRISAIILAIKSRLDPYDADAHRTMAHDELISAGYTEDEIRPWIDAIDTESVTDV